MSHIKLKTQMIKLIKLITVLTTLFTIQSCTKHKSKIVWVSGIKTECFNGAGKTTCLNIHRGEELNNAQWENLHSTIEGFEFEEGYLKKIEVKEENIENPAADASSIKYTLIKELESQIDTRTLIQGTWTLSQLNTNPINRSIVLPEMTIQLSQMQVNGTGGCNNYSGKINQLTADSIQLGPIPTTLKTCAHKNIEQEYYTALGGINTYQVTENTLSFYNEKGEETLSFIKTTEMSSKYKLHDIWNATSILGVPTDRSESIPSLEINTTKMEIYGNNGCNQYHGTIKNISPSELTFGDIASTRKICPNMNTADNFNKALSQVTNYKREGLKLILLNTEGEEVLTFQKGD